MKNINLFTCLVILCLVSCKRESSDLDHQIDTEIKQLESIKDHESYLMNIFDEDQKVRKGNSEMLKITYGPDSEEYMDYMKTQWNTDALNLRKIEKYLDLYGHPKKKDSLHYKAMSAPWAVIHHSATYEDRANNFEHMYEAYLKGDTDLSWLMDRMYKIKMRKDFVMPESSFYDRELDQMILEIGLENKKKKVEERMDL